jgi:dCTP deaminase
MILSDTAILHARLRGDIVIEPFDERRLGGNSYDVALSEHLLIYDAPQWLDCAEEAPFTRCEIGPEGFVLQPGQLYLGSTVEYTETHMHVPYLDGKSSIGRLGINIHATAGRGDVGFCNHWTLEITVAHPIKVYAGMPIGQLTFHEVAGPVQRRYSTKPGTSYGALPRDPRPQPSLLWRKAGHWRSGTG